MAHTVLLQDWTTIQGSASSTVVTQPVDDWADLVLGRDVVAFVEVADLINTINLTFETSPTKDDVLFQAMTTGSSRSVGVTTTVLRYSSATVPLARYLRWKLSGGATGAWGLTFRIVLAINVPRRLRGGGRAAAAAGGCNGCKTGNATGARSVTGRSSGGRAPRIPPALLGATPYGYDCDTLPSSAACLAGGMPCVECLNCTAEHASIDKANCYCKYVELSNQPAAYQDCLDKANAKKTLGVQNCFGGWAGACSEADGVPVPKATECTNQVARCIAFGNTAAECEIVLRHCLGFLPDPIAFDL